MSSPYRDCAETVKRLHAALESLEREAHLLQLAPLAGREWFELLRQKLLPQLHDDAFLVVAVVGGTNIGKSAIFNHLARARASGVSPLASGTKHPVCLLPEGFEEEHDLETIFEGFQLQRWTDAEAPLEEHSEDRLFWYTSSEVPPNLLVLDTPDIDSDARVNWRRAGHIRRCADLLLAVLTQQKYNDAAVKEFFRKAAEEDKAVVVVFNQCQLPEDGDYWPLWLETFCEATGVRPELVYLAPYDRRAAEENRLAFQLSRESRVESREPEAVASREPAAEGRQAATRPDHQTTRPPHHRSLAEDLSTLHFPEIKLRSLRGSLGRLVDPKTGVPEYLREIEERSTEFRTAAARLSAESVVKVADWPALDTNLFVAEIRQWWRTRHEGWAKRVHGFYNTVGQGVSWPFRAVRNAVRGEQPDPLEVYHRREWEAVLKVLDEVFEKLTWMSESAGPLLRPHFQELLSGKSRSDILARLKESHEAAPLRAELEDVVDREMDEFQRGSPELYRFYRQMNNVSAALRPATSVVLFTLGWGPAGEVVAPIVADAAAQTVVPIVADLAGGTTTAVAGESVVSRTAGRGAGYLQIKFQKLQAAFTARRVEWLVGLLKEHLVGPLPETLQQAADVPQSEPFRQVRAAVDELDGQLQTLTQHQTA